MAKALRIEVAARHCLILLLMLILAGCVRYGTTVFRPEKAEEISSTLVFTGAARQWRIGGVYDAAHIVDTNARPLKAKLRVGEARHLWCLPAESHYGRFPSIRWVSTRPDIASVVSGASTGAVLRGLSEGETEVYAIVEVYGGIRADLFYYCCGACAEHTLPRCERIPIDGVVVTQ